MYVDYAVFAIPVVVIGLGGIWSKFGDGKHDFLPSINRMCHHISNCRRGKDLHGIFGMNFQKLHPP